MNRSQALREARRRWGPTATVGGVEGRRYVGQELLGNLAHSVRGEGRTWAAAFRHADRKAHLIRLHGEAHGQPCPRCSRTIGSTKAHAPAWAHARIHDVEADVPTLDDVWCRSCALNTLLPSAVHGWSFDRRWGLWQLGGHVAAIVYLLGHGSLRLVAGALRELDDYVLAAEIGYEAARRRLRRRKP